MQETKRKIYTFTDLLAWQEGHKLVLMIYKFSRAFPEDEKFGLVAQWRRCGVSITSCLAEGFSRKTRKDKVHFYHIALGSTTEAQNQALVARDVGYLIKGNFDKVAEQSVVVHKLINGLIKGAESKYE